MILVPSIALIKGRTTRISQGNFDGGMPYDVSPLDVAQQFADHGIKRIHLIDLEGAKAGTPKNFNTLELIAGHTDLDINFAGGMHTDGDILKSLEYGAVDITAATIAVYNRDLFTSWIMSYGREKIALAADSLDGLIRVGGWQSETKIKLEDHIEYYYNRGLKYLKTTDISRDGVMVGPAFDMYEQLVKQFPDLYIFASGGVRGMDDIKKLRDIGVYGVIFGRAYHEGKITPKELDQFNASTV